MGVSESDCRDMVNDISHQGKGNRGRTWRPTEKDPAEPVGNDYEMERIEEWYKDEGRLHDQFTEGLPGRLWIFYQVFNEGYALIAFDKYFIPSRIPESWTSVAPKVVTSKLFDQNVPSACS